jgi:excisionase family DNA binding protein
MRFARRYRGGAPVSAAFLTVAQVADEVGFSPRTVLRWVERGELEAVRFPGGRLRIAESAWIAFLDERSTRPADGTLVIVEKEA